MSSASTSTAAHASHAFDVPEFAVVEAGATLRIPLSTRTATRVPAADVPLIHVNRAQLLRIASEGAHRALAPASGTMRALAEATLFSGQRVPAVELSVDHPSKSSGEQIVQTIENAERMDALRTLGRSDLGTWIERLRDAGVHADRRASPDLIAQLFQAVRRPIDTVICNLLDSDPTACLSAAIAAQFATELVAGVALVARITGATRVSIVADQRLPASWTQSIRAPARAQSARLLFIANDYPQLDPTLLLYTLLSRRLRPGRLPTEQGVIVLDAGAAWAIGRLYLADEPMLHVPITVRDHVRMLSHFVLAPIGMPLSDLLTRLGEDQTDALIRGGDLLRDLVLPRDAVFSGSELVLHTTAPEPDINPDACIRCGWCVEACPTRVQPAVILEAAQLDDIDLAERAGIEACIDCGICSYVCPSKLPLQEGIRQMKSRHDV